MSNDIQNIIDRLQRENERLRREVDALQSRLAACEKRRAMTLTDRGDNAEGAHAVYHDTWPNDDDGDYYTTWSNHGD